MKRIFKGGAAAMLATLALALPVHAADPTGKEESAATRNARQPEDAQQIERRLASVATLIESSTAALQIEKSANPQANAHREKARDLRRQASEAYQAGKLPAATRLLDEAAKALFEGVKIASPEQVILARKQRDFEVRMESVKALLGAQRRISEEKKLGAKGDQASAGLEAQMREAGALAAAGKLDQGKVLLDQVYVATRAAIEKMRDGDTLVRSLHFVNKEEEYHYEIDRNDTHRMLIKVLLEEKRASNPNLENMVQKYLEQSATLRASAETQAKVKDFEAAIKILEDSTRELVRAIRGAGVYIPG